MINGKAKGSGWERDISKFLTKWLTGQAKPYVFWRTPSSGALNTISQADSVSGDIVSIRPEGKWLTDIFSIEVKTGYPQADFFKHFKDCNDEIKDFWVQCQNDAKKANKYGMLIFKKKGHKAIVGICNNMQSYLNDMFDLHLINSIQMRFADDNVPSVNFFDMEKFFDMVKPDLIKKKT